jgi:hypothetical protein
MLITNYIVVAATLGLQLTSLYYKSKIVHCARVY